MPRNPRAQAQERLGESHSARVFEPSPPAVTDPPFFADDSVARGSELDADDRPVVSPVTTGDVLWADLVRAERPDLAEFAAHHWLGAYQRLSPPPADLARSRVALHSLAENVISPTRQRAPGGKIGLRWTSGGFGTPFFGNDVQLRVEGDVVVVQTAEREQLGRLTTLKDAAEFVGFDLTRTDVAMAEDRLNIDQRAARWLGDLFGFATSVLEQLRAETTERDSPSRVQLWPEHFDMAVDFGNESSSSRANYGVSPGDEVHDEPYLYVSLWAGEREGELWNATHYSGAELTISEVIAADDQREAALAFFRTRAQALAP